VSQLPRSCSCGRIVAKGATCSCKERQRGTTSIRGYGAAWQRLSARVIAEEMMCRDCGHLGSKDNPLTCDHIIAKIKGGTDDRDNLCCRCRRCNSAKGAKTTDAPVDTVRATTLTTLTDQTITNLMIG
jgi:5-methylcytosine-specific restriction endonuclease McrA